MHEREGEGRSVSPWLLPALMLAGAVGGAVVGSVAGARWDDPSLEWLVLAVRLCGVVFLSILKGLIVPLVVTSIISAITRMGDLQRMGKVAGLTIFYFLCTTFLAVFTGIVLVNIVRPGHAGGGAAADQLIAPEVQSTAQSIYDVIAGMFPENLIGAAADGNVLGLIVYSIFFGIVLALERKRSATLIDVIDAGNEALLRLVRYVIWLAPLGIFGLVADRLGLAGGGDAVWSELRRLGWYAFCVMAGLAIHSTVTLPLLLRFVGRRNPARYARGMADSLITAVGTASSAATLPITMRCVIHDNQVSRRAADFVIPLGATINMDGTALYEAVAVIFIAQTLGIELTLAQQVVILFTATLAAVGAAAIPEAGLVTMVIVLAAVGLPAEGIGLILSIDWILDRFRTGVNVWGDSIGAAIIDRTLPAEPLPAAGEVATPT